MATSENGKSPGSLAGLGVQFAGAIVMFTLLGRWIDGKFDTRPWGILIGAFVGFAGGFYAMVRAANGKNGG